jgi:hypothetical protein
MRLFNNYLERKRLAKLNKAVKLAKTYHELTGRKYLVLNWKGKLIVKSKQELKHLIKTNVLKTDIQNLEEISLYITQ